MRKVNQPISKSQRKSSRFYNQILRKIDNFHFIKSGGRKWGLPGKQLDLSAAMGKRTNLVALSIPQKKG